MCSENKLELWKSEIQCDVSSIHKSSQMSHKQLKHSLQLGNPSFLKDILFAIRDPSAISSNIDLQSELLGQFRIIGDRALDVSGGRICLT